MSNIENIPCSVCILTFNSSKTLERALESVKDFGEIIVNDGGSSDNTLEIAKRYNCVILSQDKKFKNPDGTIADFSGVRNQMLDIAKYDWVFILDSDEYLSSELVERIKKIDFTREGVLFNVLRKYVLDGYIIDYASTYPNRQIRLFNRKDGRYKKKLHEKVVYSDNCIIKNIDECLYVPLPNFGDFKNKGLRYLKMQLEINGDISFKRWVKILFFHLRASAIYFIRFLLLQFKRGNKLPLKYELFRHYYNLVLIVRSARNIKVR